MADPTISHGWTTAEADAGKDVDAHNLNDHAITGFGAAVQAVIDAGGLSTDVETAAAVAAEALLARNADNLTSGTVADARIAATIARDSEVTAAVAALSTVYQPLDSDLTAIAALTTTAYGRAFLALADAAAGRTALALGTAATQATGAFDAAGAAAAAQAASQPLDSDLTALAALTTTAYGRSLLETANAAALRTLAGLGTAAVAASTDFLAATAAAGGDLAGNYPNPTVQDDSHSHTSATLPAAGADLSGVDFLVGTASGLLSAEIPVGTTPGGELGGTWASPTVDATHSGSSHVGTQSAAEATAAGALSTHVADTTSAHTAAGIDLVDVADNYTSTNVEAAFTEVNQKIADEAFTRVTELNAHAADTTSIHGITNTANLYAAGGTDVAVADGGTGASSASGARTNLGVVIGTDVRAQGSGDPTRASLGLDTTDSPQFAGVNVGAATDTTITRTGAGDIAVEGNALYRAGGTDVPIADGGTGASTKAAAFDALSPMTTAGDIIIGGASGTGTRLAAGATSGHVLTSNGSGAAPSYQAAAGGSTVPTSWGKYW